MRSPATIGVDTPRPPSDAFQATFSVALQRTGRSFSSEIPLPCGPRHCGQSAAATEPPIAAARTAPSFNERIIVSAENSGLPVRWQEAETRRIEQEVRRAGDI